MKTLFISAGHSETDPGAVAYGRKEADVAVEFRNMVSFYLTRAGAKHDIDGTGTINLPLRQAAKMMMQHQVGVEFHCNAAASQNATGCEVLCAPKDNHLAALICDALATTLLIRSRGVKPENSGQHSRLAFVQAGGMIVELFFITNRNDMAAYDARKWLAARAVAGVLLAAV